MWKRRIRAKEDIAHVVRRLGVGANPDIVELYEERDDAIAACLEYRDTSVLVPEVDPPLAWDDVTGLWGDQTLFQWWIGRYLDGTVGYDDLLAGITVGPGPSRAMLGSGSFVVNIQDAGGLSSQVPWWIDEEGDFFATWGGFAPVDVPLGELTPVERAIGATVRANSRLSEGLRPLQTAVENGEVPEDEQWTIQGQMRLAANLITSGVAPRVIYLHGMGDFDTHENLVSRQAALMTDINSGIKTFYEIIDAAGVGDEVILMTTSEFGRRADENGEGTDHGTASSQFIIGSSVTGGRYGDQPSLTKLDPDGNLIHTVDFRSTFATVLDDWLGVEHSAVLEGSFEMLPFLQT